MKLISVLSLRILMSATLGASPAIVLSLFASEGFGAGQSPVTDNAETPQSSAADTSKSKAETPEGATIFKALEAVATQPKGPLGGSFADGEKMLRAADPEAEANLVYNAKGFQLIKVCGFACFAPGATSDQQSQAIGSLTLPATGDVINERNKGYNEIAQDFAAKFNQQMLQLKFPQPKSPASIAKALTDAELTMNGVTIGKSNLYNSIGRFGTNAFHHEGDAGDSIYVICWKGADGTTVAFESGELGGRDQTILEGRLLASGAEYRFDKFCKPSRKVDAKISLFGVHLGDSAIDIQKVKGAPTTREDDKLAYHYLTQKKHGKKSADVQSNVKFAFKDDKAIEISVGKTETY